MEWLIRISIWASVLFWAAAVIPILFGDESRAEQARKLWTWGLAAFLIHVAGSFHEFYGWSHATALTETARQTAEVTGRETGFGLWLNYLFGAVWLADAAFWWGRGHAAYFGRARWINVILHGFLMFMIFNGAVVFVDAPMRWLGVAIFVGLAALWLRARVQSRSAAKNHAGF